MKILNIIKRGALVALLLASVWACKESFLELTPQGALSSEVLGNELGAENALIGAYAMLDGYNIDNNNTWPADPWNWIMGSVPSDDAYKGSEQGDLGEATELETYEWSAGNSLLNQKWIPLYEGVVRANSTLSLLAQAVASDKPPATAVSDRIEGEARFLRAYYHFELYKVWGNIAYFTEEDTDFKKTNQGGDPLGDAIADLVVAVQKLPPTQNDAGRVDQKGARAFLGKLYMWANNPTAAKTELDLVVNSTNLADCQRDLFEYSNENHESALFSVQMSTSSDAQARNSNWLNQLANPQGAGFGCCGFHQPSQNLVNAFKVDANGLPLLDTFNDNDLDPANDPVDPRLDLVAGRDGVPYWDWDIHAPDWIRSRDYSGPYSPKKVQPYKAADAAGRPGGGWNGPANNGTNYPVIRLADAILLLAEAEVAGNNLGRAEELVNLVRVRAGNCAQGPLIDAGGEAAVIDDINDAGITWATYDVQPYPTGTFASNGAAFALKAVKFERRLELALEGHRFFDLRRWNDTKAVLDAYIAVEKTKRTYLEDARAIEDRHALYPIPSQQVELNKGLAEGEFLQNSGW